MGSILLNSNNVANQEVSDNKDEIAVIRDGKNEKFHLLTQDPQHSSLKLDKMSRIDPEPSSVTQEQGEPSDLFEYDKHQESMYDDPLIFPCLKGDIQSIAKFDTENSDVLNHATIRALIVQLTSPEVVDYNLIYDFFVSYRMFIDSETVMNHLMSRLIWSLQYINKKDEESNKLGTLVLLRTFVVLRHWILNYFVDDFNSNYKLCDILISNLNQIVFQSKLIAPGMVFERKIFKDLKIHWISQVIEFWHIELDFDLISKEIFSYWLPSISELSEKNFLKKSSTEMSIHTNPSYRRSAMLSLYDQKVLHPKSTVPDETRAENPQLSISNLLVQHKSSRQSIINKLNYFNLAKTKAPIPTNSAGSGSGSGTNTATASPDGSTESSPVMSPTNRYYKNRMNLNDSSIGLKKTSNKLPEQQNNLDKISLNPITIENVGFTTNGNVKLPSSKISTIIPSTPVKKMDYIVRSPDVDAVINESDDFEPFTKPNSSHLDFNRKNSLKRILESWKKSKVNKEHEEINEISEIIDKDIIGDRFDVLSARINDELDFLIRYYVQSDSSYNPPIIEGDSIDNSNIAIDDLGATDIAPASVHGDASKSLDGPAVVQSAEEPETLDTPTEFQNKINDDDDYDQEVDINDLSELNINKIDNLINENDDKGDADSLEIFNDTNDHFEDDQPISPSFAEEIHEFSFQRPTSINWNSEQDLEFERSQLNSEASDNSNNELDQYMSDEQQQQEANEEPQTYQHTESDGELPEPNLPRDNSEEMINPTDLAEPNFTFNKNISNVSTISTPSDLTNYDAEIEALGIAVSPNQNQTKRISFNYSRRFSRSSSNSIFKRDSVKSYVSYDSAFSASRESFNLSGDTSATNNNLRKKAGVNNLRTLAGLPSERMSLEVPARVPSSNRKSVRYSTILALSELPFNGQYDSRSSINVIKRASRSSGVGDSSIFSVAMKSRNSIANSFQTLNESAPYNGSDMEGEEEADTSKQSIAIPGISNLVLKELAAIPDESFLFDPIDFALVKLEGTRKSADDAKNVYMNQTSNGSELTHVDDTQDILDEINNAHTEDIIDTSSQKDFTSERPLTPQTDSGSIENNDASTPASKLIQEITATTVDNDNVFIFSANYSGSGSSNGGTTTYRSPRLILENYNLANEALNIKNIFAKNSHISFMLSYNSKELAEHFTVIERDILQDIEWKELIELKWNKELTPVNSWLEIIVNEEYFNANKGINLVIARFNLMVNWIISEILLTKDQFERCQIISRFIHVAQNCLTLQNYSSLMQILLALTSEKITKLKETWKNVIPGDLLMLRNLEKLASPLKNFINLRISINKIQPSKGCIPFVGLYLSDLIFNTERPKFIDSSKTLINFARFRTSVHIVKSLIQSIEWSCYYKLNINKELLSKCLYIRSLYEDEMNHCLESMVDP